MLTPSQDCIYLIKESERLHRIRMDGNIEAYMDPGGVWTIGYGSTFNIDASRVVEEGDVITPADAERYLHLEIEKKSQAVNNLCQVELTQSMFDALVSFGFNVGVEENGLKTSTLLRKLNDKKYEEASREFERWIFANGQQLPGLVIRRNKEKALFLRDGFPGETQIVINTEVADKDWEFPKIPLAINRTLIEGNTGEDCFILNCGLAALGYLATGVQPAKYTSFTQEALLRFQSENRLKVDGKFGPKTKAALTTKLDSARMRVEPKLNTFYCRLTRTYTQTYDKLEKLLLEFISPQGNVLDKLEVVSGAPGHQNFRIPEDINDFPGNLEPLPQGRYVIGDILWADGKDNYDGNIPADNNGIGPIFVPFTKTFHDDKPRDAFGFHLDRNRYEGFPGSAGCVCLMNMNDLKKLVQLLRRYDPRDLFVDWEIR